MKLLSLFLLSLASSLSANTLPGFRVEDVADVPGFVTSVAVDSHGKVYCTTSDGWIHRIDDGTSVAIASLPTKAGGNAGLLGMALADDDTAVVHYTTWLDEVVLDDVVSLVDLSTGAETVLQRFVCNVEVRELGVSSEHHGGNPTVADDGSIFVGIGEYNVGFRAQESDWNAGKIFRIDRDGHAEQYARGLRNPYDLAWDPELQRLVVSDNGPTGGDELHIIEKGDNCGWPMTFGDQPAVAGTVAPDYVFASTVAPTGMQRLTRDANNVLRHGYLLTTFVTSALYYFPDLAARPIPDPLPVIDDFDSYLIDVAQARDGTIYLASARFPADSRIHRLIVPMRGDCNGDGLLDSRDVLALLHELGDGDGQPVFFAQDGAHRGSWGCDTNGDEVIDAKDLDALSRLIGRRRAVRVR
ncbi:MAG TPA: PQQ-dependent sugar dehydrogenase [Thermoanaerobaculia bacterium]|nr:PQQ-dependent sugar dehydrogenase [Thermoanaerobaculia bacterium]